jgi:hypothetical protein
VIFFFGIEIEHGTFEVQRIHPVGCDVRASRTSRARSPGCFWRSSTAVACKCRGVSLSNPSANECDRCAAAYLEQRIKEGATGS